MLTCIAGAGLCRVGRVARQGRSGMALSLVTGDEVAYMLDTLLFLGRPVTNVFHEYVTSVECIISQAQ